MSKELLVTIKHKRGIHKGWKQGLVTRDEYKELARETRNWVRKAKALTELNLSMDIKDNRKGFYQYLREKKKMRECGSPLEGYRSTGYGGYGKG